MDQAGHTPQITNRNGDTGCYSAPEVLRDKDMVSTWSDMWSFGCLYYEVKKRKMAFVSEHQMYAYATNREAQPLNWDGISAATKELIENLLNVLAEMRPAAYRVAQQIRTIDHQHASNGTKILTNAPYHSEPTALQPTDRSATSTPRPIRKSKTAPVRKMRFTSIPRLFKGKTKNVLTPQGQPN